ncbi:phage antirepressor KilAC domain-containing protein (plasmid) [Marinobacter sp. M3C]|jgi:phage antirepressor YoqD-like protein|uniref:phage antirepressor KilAC domain-containing protein n=1 Tax=Marinobacter sp. M3C TaxID=2917715 RepID=UPI00200DC87C|nr:phage antirepressor KilAC domain-containing protein [Marinobacter sp. M3C]MCL1485149.1 phage antirepressor KilAC domain-containing protein [Marinobacter sp.]UQG62828.1 phage antirepressor KilAC domain-containing protein [Marinobacter sp. M3C]
MTGLILSSKNNEPTMSSRDIAGLCEKDHKHVLTDIRKMLEELEIQSAGFSAQYKDSTGRTLPCFSLPRRECDILIAGYNIRYRAAIVDRWRELESNVPALPDFSNPAIAARAWADEMERKQVALSLLEQAKPAIEFVDRYVTAETGSKGFRQVAKLLGVNEFKFRAFLEEKGIMYKLGGEWTPYQQHMDAGRFVVRAGVAKNDHAYNGAKFTPKGINWVAGKWAVNNLQGGLE